MPFTSFLALPGRRFVAALLAGLLLVGALAPGAFAAAAGIPTATAAAKKPKCPKGKKAVRKKKRVRVKGRSRIRKVWVCVRVTAPAAAKDTRAPSRPGALDGAPGDGAVTLLWSASSDDVRVTGYRVQRDGAVVGSPNDTTFRDAGLANGRAYRYDVAALDAAGNVSEAATVTVTPRGGADVTPPGAPPAFTATGGDRQVTLTWGAANDDTGVTKYVVTRDGNPIAYQADRGYTDTGLTNGTTYSYGVVAYDAAGNASPTSTASATPADTAAPTTPTGLTATPADGQVSLVWTASTDNVGVTGYRVYRDGTLAGSPTDAYFTDDGLTNNVPHSYTVVAVDAAGNTSPATAPAGATPNPPSGSDAAAPSVPQGLQGTPGTNQAQLTWSPSTDDVGVTGYRVYRDNVQVGAPAGPSFNDTGLTNGTTYVYKVTALDAAGHESGFSTTVSVKPADLTAPSVPGGLALVKDAAAHSITVSWTASTDNVGVVRYKVWRNGTLIGQPTGTSLVDKDLSNGATYAYTVAAVDAAGNVSAQAPTISTYVS